MKKTLLLFCIFLACFAFLPAQNEEMCKIIEGEKLAAQWKIQMQRQAQTTSNTDDYDVKYYRLQLEVNPAVNFIRGKITTYFAPKVSGFMQMTFDAAASLNIDSAKYHGQVMAVSLAQNDQRTFYFPAILNANQLDSISIWYKGAPVGTGFGSFVQTTHGGTPVIWTLSEPYGAKDWWVCKQTLDDKADSVDVFIKTPNQYKAGSNGLLVNTLAEGNYNTYHWKHRYPIATYLVAIAVTNYAVYSDHLNNATGNLEILNYVYPEDSATAASSTPVLLDVIPYYESKFGNYPFRNEKYGHAQFGWGGGMEHQTMTFASSWGFMLLSHELAHQWFGDAVTCNSWGDIFLNEGFATYCAAMADEALSPPSVWDYWKQTTINDVSAQPNGSVYCTDTTSVNRLFDWRLTYQKGALFLHQMRWQLGDSLFFLGIKNYHTDPANYHKYGSIASLKAHWEAVSGQNLTEFFNDWYYGQGYPTYNISWSQATNGKVYFKLNQTTSDASVPFYEMPVPILLGSSGVQTQMVVLNHTYSGQIFEITPAFTVANISFDPERWLLAKSNVTIDNTLAIENSVTFSVAMQPNPAKDMLHLDSGNTQMEKGKIMDLQGRLVKEFSINHFQSDISVAEMCEGMYLIQLFAGEKMYQNKLIIKH